MKKILIVDDDLGIIEMIKKNLESAQFEVISAQDGEKGLIAAKSEIPDLILMDIMMPNLSGGDAVKLLEADEQTKNIPIIFITGIFGENDVGEENRGVNVAGKTYKTIGKPFDPKRVVHVINETITK